MLGPILDGERVRLVPPQAEHLATFVRWFADRRVTRFLSLRFPPSLREEQEWLEARATSESDIVWAIVAKDGARLVGSTGLDRIDPRDRHAWNGIVIGDPADWGKGYGTDAIRLTTGFGFAELGLEKLLTGVFVENAASRRIMDKIGFRSCGLLRRQHFRDGGWHDEWLGEILREEWKA